MCLHDQQTWIWIHFGKDRKRYNEVIMHVETHLNGFEKALMR
jgi:hypothetical protein